MMCKLCRQNKQLIEAHIIPRSLYKPLQDGSGSPRIGSNKPGFYPKRSPIGVYDKQLICGDCEKFFSPWDDYAQELLLRRLVESNYITSDGEKLAYQVKDVNYRKLKLFFVSLLWRAAASKQEFFTRIQVGPFEEKLKQMILNGDPGDPETFAVCLAKFDDPLGTIMLDPHCERWFGINYCRFYLAGYVTYIKVDKRPPAEFMDDFILAPNRPLLVILRNLRASKEFQLMKQLVKASFRRSRPN